MAFIETPGGFLGGKGVTAPFIFEGNGTLEVFPYYSPSVIGRMAGKV
jgi:hypothetical protein